MFGSSPLSVYYVYYYGYHYTYSSALQDNSLRPSDAYMRQQTNHHWFRLWPVAWPAPSHYLNQCWNIVNWAIGNKPQWNLKRNSYIFTEENAFENVVLKMASILSRLQCDNYRVTEDRHSRAIYTNEHHLFVRAGTIGENDVTIILHRVCVASQCQVGIGRTWRQWGNEKSMSLFVRFM